MPRSKGMRKWVPDPIRAVPVTSLWSEAYAHELWDEGAVWKDGRIWIPYRLMFPIGDLDELSEVSGV